MATGAFQDITTELKNVYPTGTFEEPVNKVAKFRRDLQKVDLAFSEGIGYFPLGVSSAWNIGMIADLGNFPTPIDPTRVQGKVTPEIFVGSFQLGLKTKVAAKSSKGTFNVGGIMADRVENTVSELGKYINRVYVGSNGGGMAVVESNSGSSTIVLTRPLGAELLNKGMRVDFHVANTASQRTAVATKLTTVTRSTRTIIYTASNDATIAAGDYVYIENTFGREIWTLTQIIGDSTDKGVIFTNGDRSVNPELSAFVFRSSSNLRDLTEQLMLDAIDAPYRETGKNINKALTNTGQGRKYVEFIQAERRYAGPSGAAPRYTVGYDEDSLQIIAPGVNVKLEVDVDCEPRRIYFLAWDTFGRYESMALDWIDEDTLLKLIPTSGGHKAGFLAYVGCVENIINTMPRASSRLEDLNDPIAGD
jgi:hypothetical protein